MRNESLLLGFARLWGQYEISPVTTTEKAVSEELRKFDDEDMVNIIEKWAEEFQHIDKDMCEFFESKIYLLAAKSFISSLSPGDVITKEVEEGHCITTYKLRITSVEPDEETNIFFGEPVSEEDKEAAEEFGCFANANEIAIPF